MKSLFFAAIVILTAVSVKGQLTPTCDKSTGISETDCEAYVEEGAIIVTFDDRSEVLSDFETELFKAVIANVTNYYDLLEVLPEHVIIVQRVRNTNTDEVGLMFFILNPFDSMPALRSPELYLMVKLNNKRINDNLGMDVTALMRNGFDELKGISRLVSVKVNPYRPSSFTCYVEGNPVPSETSVNLYRYTGGTFNNTGITRRSSSVSGSERAVVFDVDSVYPEDYVCSLLDGNGGLLIITNLTYVLPVIDVAPIILSTTSTTVRLQWNTWSEGDDIGDPPLVGYDVLVKRGSDWVTDQRDQPFTSATVRNLNPDTEHRFRVAAVREGPGGTGPPSPEVRTTTLCGKPTESPQGLQAAATNPKELELTWQPISSESAACRSGITHYVIYYFTPSGSASSHHVRVYGVTSYILGDLETFLDYTIQITASNEDEESDKSNEIIGKTLEEVAPAPINVAIPRSTTSSFTVSWSTPLPSNINGNIQKYIIRYQQTAPIGDNDYKIEEVLVDVFEGEHTVMDLPAQTNYTVLVQTVNGVGSSDWSEPVNAKTVLSGDDGRTTIPVGAVVGGVMVPLIIILLLVLALFSCRRVKRRQSKAESPSSSPYCASETSPKHENPVFDDSKTDPHAYQDLPTNTPNCENLTDLHTCQDLKKPVIYQNVTNSSP